MTETLSGKENVNLLWTGGWDSTFQLLRLLLIDRRRVTPFYLTDAERRSTGMELRSIERIKGCILKEYPHTRELLQPTRHFAVADISPDSQITESYQAILKEKYLGSQYDWLARFCKEHGITDMQLCVQADLCHDNAYFNFEPIVSESTDYSQTVFRLDPKFKMMNEYVLFRYFSFPVIKLTKIQMSAIVKKHGWMKIMDMTWFCHKPTSNMAPCGKCNPCLQTMEEGLGRRIPARTRIVIFFNTKLFRPLKSQAKIILGKLGLLKYIRKSK